jgi:uncharacterized protein YfaS (alpha-2-macroglobulin family)
MKYKYLPLLVFLACLLIIVSINPSYADNSKSFTILDIYPDLSDRTVKIRFSAGCYTEDLRSRLRFNPPVRVQWPYYSSQQHEFTFKGEFKPGQQYSIFIPETVSCSGLSYQETKRAFKMPDMASSIDFVEKGSVIERNGRQMLHANLTNVEELLFQGLKIPPILAPQAVDVTFEKTKEGLENRFKAIKPFIDSNPALREFAGEIVEERQLFFAGKDSNAKKPFSIPLSFRREREKGAIEIVSLKSNRNDQPAHSPTRLFRITDIGLTYKVSNDSLLIWATSLNTGKPLEDVSLLAFIGQHTAVPLGKTDKHGIFIIKGFDGKQRILLDPNNKSASNQISLNDIRFIIAVSPSDSTFIEIDPSGFVRPDWVKQSHIKTVSSRLLRGHVFTERGIYRPGETVYFKGTVREYKGGYIVPPKDLEPRFEIVNSKGESVYDNKIRLSDFGTANGSIVAKPYFPLGTYTLKMAFGEGEDGTVSRTFQVQEFQPPRHFTEVRLRPEKRKDKRYVNIDKESSYLNCEIAGIYYAGGPVKHGKVRWKVYYNSSDFRKNSYKDYNFGNPREKREELLESGESVLDEKGRITVSVPMSKEVISGLYAVEVFATVVDFDGRAAAESAVYQEEPEYLVGISSHKDSIKAGESDSLNVIVVDKSGKKVEKGTVTVEVMRKEYTWIRKRNDIGDVYWVDQMVWRKQVSSKLAIENGSAAFDFDFVNGGEYLIKFTYHEGGKSYTSGTRYHVEGYFYGYEYESRDRNFERLTVSPEKSEYAPGETVRVYINPHKKLSSLLMTVEREGIIEHNAIEIAPGRRYIDIPVKKSFAPNVYVSFLGTVARGEFPVYNGQFDDDAPAFLFGVVNVQIRRDAEELKIAIDENTPDLKAEPGSEVRLKITAKDASGAGAEAEIAVCVVDESVLAMTGFETPTLDTLLKFISPLSVFTGDLRSYLLRQTPFNYIGNEPLTGGDGIGKKPEAATSKIRKDFNPVAYFNPAVITNKNGEAEVTFRLPDTMTTYRVYAVACDKGSRFASTQRGLLSVKNFYLEPGVPRFFTKGDRFKMFVSAFNKTDKPAPVSFFLGKDDLVTMTTPSLNYAVKTMDRALIPVEGEALKPGISKLFFSGKMNGRSDAIELSVPVNSGYLMMTDTVFGTVSNAAKIRYAIPEGTEKIKWSDLKPGEVKAHLTLSGSPFLRMTQGLRYLLHYPYGCVEQTSSGVLPLAGLRGLIKEGLIPDIRIEETDKFLKPGIARLLSMQTSSGGFAYWPGNIHPDRWGTIYATTALTHAKLAGFDVPQDQMNLAMNYLKGAIKETNGDKTFIGFASYVLALNRALDEGTFRDAYRDINSIPREGALLLILSGKIMNYLPEQELVGIARPLLEGRWDGKASDVFYARYREPAISLMAANALMPRDPVVGKLAKQLMGGVNNQGIWTSTSDTGWSLVALGEYFKGSSFSDRPVKVTLRQEGWPETVITLDPKKSYTYTLEPSSFLKRPDISIFVEGNINLVYSLSLTYPRVDYAAQGYSNGFRINKTIENSDGSKTIRVGDIVKVTLDLDIEGDHFNYIVLDDPLPAGFVAINSAIKTEEIVPKKAKKSAYNEEGEGVDDEGDYYWDEWDYHGGFYKFTPNYFEIRDDRVLVFKDRSWRGRYQYIYYARAVCQGDFVLPSTKIQLMYDPTTVSYTPVGKVTVQGRE